MVKHVLVTGAYGLIGGEVYLHLDAQPERYVAYALARRRRPSERSSMARKLHISDQTVRRWCEAKRIPARRFGPGQHWQIPLIIIEEIQLSYRG